MTHGKSIPAHGLPKEEVFSKLEELRNNDVAWRTGKAFAYVYDGGREVEEVAKKAFNAFMTENGLDPTAFPSLLRFENDLIAMARAHLRGDEKVVGSFTSGGTESIILAMKTARDWARKTRGMADVEVIVPVTAHAAFHKAGAYLGIKVVTTPIDPTTMRADVAAMKAAINERTAMLVGSASGYAHGVVDPIGEIAGLAKERGILCHVDGCIGGFVLPYFKRFGADVPDFDFSVPGVTSMSMDLHKYALTPKGASVVLYANDDLRRHQFFACASWTGYTMVNTTVQSTKSGGPLAAAWAVMHFLGDEGYVKIMRALYDAKNAIEAGIRAIPGLYVMGKPEMTLLGFTSDELPIFPIVDEMKKRGWLIQPQLAYGGSKENLHITIQPSNVPHAEAFLTDLRASVDAVRKKGAPDSDALAMARALAERLSGPDGEAMLPGLLDAMGIGSSGTVPAEMADTNALMNLLPRPVQERLLVHVVARLFQPSASAS
jgi:glutamate/tyrosine decarboxylase-like PLP-dependent enzyme